MGCCGRARSNTKVVGTVTAAATPDGPAMRTTPVGVSNSAPSGEKHGRRKKDARVSSAKRGILGTGGARADAPLPVPLEAEAAAADAAMGRLDTGPLPPSRYLTEEMHVYEAASFLLTFTRRAAAAAALAPPSLPGMLYGQKTSSYNAEMSVKDNPLPLSPTFHWFNHSHGSLLLLLLDNSCNRRREHANCAVIRLCSDKGPSGVPRNALHVSAR
jgi:hypothetical protein